MGIKYTTSGVFESCSRSDYGISEIDRYKFAPVIGISVDFILFVSAICVSKRLGSD